MHTRKRHRSKSGKETDENPGNGENFLLTNDIKSDDETYLDKEWFCYKYILPHLLFERHYNYLMLFILYLEAKLLYNPLCHTIFLNNSKTYKDRHFKLGTLDLYIVTVILTKWA